MSKIKGLNKSLPFMHPSLQHIYKQLEEQRATVLAMAQALPGEALHRAPAPGKWSLMQILAHLVTAEKMSLAYLQKKILGIDDATDTGWKEDLRIGLLKISQRLPLKFKAPGRVVESTPAYTSFDQLRSDWDSVRAQLAEILERFPENRLKRKVYKHPFAGMLNITQMLIFFREHITHHQPQIRRVLK